MKAGFTLLEIGIVLGIVGLIVGMSVSAMDSTIDSARIVNTNEKLKAIDNALAAYWQVNNRLPCPADGSDATSDVNYGIASSNTSCNTATEYSHLGFRSTTEGMVPFVTLGLPESYAYDGWGRRIVYVTSPRLTWTNAAFQHQSNSACRFVELAPHTPLYHPAFMVFSHGENGFGARTKAGDELLTAGASTVDGTNAHNSITSPFGGITYYGMYSTTYSDPDSDDIIHFKTLAQLNSDSGGPQGLEHGGENPVLFFSSSTSPYAFKYTWDGDNFLADGNYGTTPGGAPQGKITASPMVVNCHRHILHTAGAGSFADCQYASIGGSNWVSSNCTPSTHTSTTAFNSNAFFPNPSGLQHGELVFGYGSSPYLHYSTQETSTTSNVHSTTTTSAGTSAYEPDTAPAGIVYGTEYSLASGHLAVAHATSPYVTIYDRATPTGLARVKTTYISADYPTGNATDVAYSPDSRYLAVSHATSPYVTIYGILGDTYTKITNPVSLPTGNANAVSFSHDGEHLVVAHETSPYITVYSINKATDTFTKLTDPTSLPSGTANDVDFACGTSKFAVAVASTSGNKQLMIYNVEHGGMVVEATNIDSEPATGGTGYAVEFADCNKTAANTTIATGPASSGGIITNGLRARWEFEEGSGSAVADSSGNGYNASMAGGTYSWTNSVSAPSSTWGAFGGYGGAGVSSDLGITTTVSISAWVQASGAPTTWDGIVGKTSTFSDGYGLYFMDDGNVYFFVQSNSYKASMALTQTNWNHVVGTYDGSTIRIYVNGVEGTSYSLSSGNLASGATSFRVGGRFGFNNLYSLYGNIDSVRVYNRALTPSEVSDIYAGNG